jgi:hypothetical protein
MYQMGVACRTGAFCWMDVVLLGAIISGVTTLGSNGMTPVFQNAALIFFSVSVCE